MPAVTQVLTQEQFPCPPGNLYHSVADIAGPSSYTQVTFGATPSGGQAVSLPVPGFGVSVIWASAMAGSTAQWGAHCILKPFLSGQGSQTGLILQWYVIATGAEVAGAVDLSGQSVRVYSMGR